MVLPDLKSFAATVNDRLLAHATVAHVRSSVVLDRLKETARLPLSRQHGGRSTSAALREDGRRAALRRHPVTVMVVGAMIAGKPALELGVAVLAPHCVDRLDVGSIDGELDLETVRARRVDRLAVAVIGLAE